MSGVDPIFRETEANIRPRRRLAWPASVGMPELSFAAGLALLVVAVGLVSVPAAFAVAGLLLMLAAWRAA